MESASLLSSFSSLPPTLFSLKKSSLPPSSFLFFYHRASNRSIHPPSLPVARLPPPSTGIHGSPRRGTREKPTSDVSPHRAAAVVRLLRIELGGAFADLLNEKGRKSRENEMGYIERTLGFRTRDLEDRDVRLVTDIVGGTVRWRRYLDHLIMSLCTDERLFRDMEPLLLQILRVGFYEILKLEMPPYAVLDENVELAKAALRPGAGNLVNGILRKLVSLKETDSLPLPKVEGDNRSQARALAIIYSHPVWMVRRWMRYMGLEDCLRLMDWNNSSPHFCLRVNSGKGYTRDNIVNQLVSLKVPHVVSPFIEDFVRLQTGMQAVIQAGLLKEGICSVQDESAGLVVSVLDPQPGETIIDCCAAPGGKTLSMASRLKNQGMILAIDINKGRLRILKETAKLHAADNVITTINADLRMYSEKQSIETDKVLLDAPCSGLGVLAKRADLRWNRSLVDLEQLKNLQDELLDAASKLVKPGGVLVYSTCSIDPEENEERVAAFLDRHPEFAVHKVHEYVPPDFVTEEGYFSSNPVKHQIDGAFAARLAYSLFWLFKHLLGEETLFSNGGGDRGNRDASYHRSYVCYKNFCHQIGYIKHRLQLPVASFSGIGSLITGFCP